MNRRLLLLLSAVAIGTAVYAQSRYGSFVGRVAAEWDSNGRTMTLLEPFAYVDPEGFTWKAPKGSRVDGASIPKIAWSLIGGPFEGRYREASVIHDVACIDKTQSWRKVHRAFYTGMLAAGVTSRLAKVMYAAVYHLGPRWTTRETRTVCRAAGDCRTEEVTVDAPPYVFAEKDFPRLRAQILEHETASTSAFGSKPYSLDDIDALVPLR